MVCDDCCLLTPVGCGCFVCVVCLCYDMLYDVCCLMAVGWMLLSRWLLFDW